jgi:hypothetical protein
VGWGKLFIGNEYGLCIVSLNGGENTSVSTQALENLLAKKKIHSKSVFPAVISLLCADCLPTPQVSLAGRE